MKKRIGTFLAGLLANLLLLLTTLVLVVYFLGVGQPGRAMMADLAREEINGRADLGHLVVDPLAARASLFDLAVQTEEGEQVLSIGALQVTADSLTEKAFSRLLIKDVAFNVKQFEDGRWNLDGFLVEKPEKAPKPPSLLRIDDLQVNNANLSLSTPDLDVAVGPLTLAGSVLQPAGKEAGGHIKGRINTFAVAPKSALGKELLTGLNGSAEPLALGPLDADVNWDGPQIDVRSVELTLDTLRLYLQGQVDALAASGNLSLMATRDGKQVGALLARRQKDDWAFSAQWSLLEIPGHVGEHVTVPALELSGLTLSALPAQFSFKLNRLGIDQLAVDQTTLNGVSLSGSVQYESKQRIDLLLNDLADGKATLSDIAANWTNGDAVLALLVKEIRRDDQSVIAPARIRVEVRRTKDNKLRADLTVALHPHGTLRAELTADLRQRGERIPFVAQLHIEGLETTALLELLDVPGMLKGMVSGRLEGSLEIAGNDLGNPTVKVPYCRFELRRKQGGDMVFRTPDDEQVWDFGAAPSFSFFTKELKFGSGKLVMEVVPQG